MDLLGALEMEFREILKRYGKAREELSQEDCNVIEMYIKGETGYILDHSTIRMLYNSFYAEYWKNHVMTPRKGREAA